MLAPPLQADTITLSGTYNTGVDGNGNPLPDNAVDPHYLVVQAPDIYPSYPNLYATHPFPAAWYPWGSVTAGAVQWISPRSGYGDRDADAIGTWGLQTTFTVPATVDLTTILLWGALTSDNCVTGIAINGVAVRSGNTLMTRPGCISQPHPFQIGGWNVQWNDAFGGVLLTSGAFRFGVNTLTFYVHNDSLGESKSVFNPTGLGAWYRGNARPAYVPEASSGLLVAAGLAGFAAWRRTRQA